MAVSSTVFYALAWGVPLVAALIVLGLAGVAKHKAIKLTVFLVGFLGVSTYAAWFEFGVKTQTMPVYTANSCEDGAVQYQMPFGTHAGIAFDAQPADPDDTWLVVRNLTDQPLVINETIYTYDGSIPTGGAHLDGYDIPAQQTHGLTIARDNFYFLQPSPETFEQVIVGGQLHKYSVQCAS